MNDTYPEPFGIGLTLTIDDNKSAFFQLFSYKYCGWGWDFLVSCNLPPPPIYGPWRMTVTKMVQSVIYFYFFSSLLLLV